MSSPLEFSWVAPLAALPKPSDPSDELLGYKRSYPGRKWPEARATLKFVLARPSASTIR